MTSRNDADISSTAIGKPWARALVWAIVLVVMGIGLLGYLNPSLRLNWETIATMCGF